MAMYWHEACSVYLQWQAGSGTEWRLKRLSSPTHLAAIDEMRSARQKITGLLLQPLRCKSLQFYHWILIFLL
ncbi:hypothetical protein, partial [Undibacterium luofuense]|uniref:hypothetical protein n=1 Tax=Undibacterium luofuense TaxID=2828733 RepID=UPI0030ED62C2